MSYWPIYQTGTTVLVPHVLKIEGGPRAEVKPYRMLDTDHPDLASKLMAVLSSENVKVVYSDVPRDETAEKEFLSILNARNWEDLYRKCRNWQVFKRGERFDVERWKSRRGGRGMEPDPEASSLIEKGMPLVRLVDFFTQELKAS